MWLHVKENTENVEKKTFFVLHVATSLPSGRTAWPPSTEGAFAQQNIFNIVAKSSLH